jgi:cob(I)alamin adenosyltransferase
VLTGLERDLWVLMSELATDDDNRGKLTAGASLVTAEMVAAVEATITEVAGRFELAAEFVVPGQDRSSALLDVARTVVRRAERAAAAVAVPGSFVIPYLNRLSSLLWTLARWVEGEPLRARGS